LPAADEGSGDRSIAFVDNLAAGASTQTFIVDASGGPGTAFVDLPVAVAAVPDGAVLDVRPGVYTPFAVANKSLTIVVADPNTTQLMTGDVTIGPLPADRAAVPVGTALFTQFFGWHSTANGAQAANTLPLIVRGP
jgi:hypothetical protein